MSNFSSNIYAKITNKRSLPYSAAGTGTIVTDGIAVVGTGTLFTSEMPVGSILVDLTQTEWRRVVRVMSDTLAYVSAPFSLNITTVAPNIIHNKTSKCKMISLSTAANCLLNGVAFTGVIQFNKLGTDRTAKINMVDPVIVDAQGNDMYIEIVY